MSKTHEISKSNRRAKAPNEEHSEKSRQSSMLLETPAIEPSLESIDDLAADTIAIGLTSDGRPLTGAAGYVDWRLCGHLSKLLLQGVVTGARKEKVLFPTMGRLPTSRLLLFGWGPRDGVLVGAAEHLRWMAEVLLQVDAKKVAIALPEPARPLLSLVDEHLKKTLGDRLVGVFEPDDAP